MLEAARRAENREFAQDRIAANRDKSREILFAEAFRQGCRL
jgi:hypothetical protein